jgi:hypothetical protein
MPKLRLLLLLVLLPFLVIPRVHAEDDTHSLDEKMQSWWDDLEKDEPDASRALLNFCSHPGETIAFLKTRLLPLKLDPDEADRLIKDLESDDETVWKPSYEKLRYLDPRLAFDLPVLMNNVTNPTARSRLVEILSDREQGSLAGKKIEYNVFKGGQNFVVNNSSFWAEKDISHLCGRWNEKAPWTRALRAIVLLEHIGSPDAIAILKDMSTGNPDAQPTKCANAALDNLNVSH